MDDPFPRGQTWRYRFRSDHTYAERVEISAGYEMLRREGTLVPAGEDRIRLRQVAENGLRIEGEARTFRTDWASDADGEYLRLTADPEAYEIYLRPVSSAH
jgi:hypothetical protein